MKRHAFDMTSFLFGIVLGGAAVGFLLADQLSWDVDGRWVLPAALILLGVVGIAGAFSGLRPGRESLDAERDDARDAAADDVGDQVTAATGAVDPASSQRDVKSS